VPAQYTALHDCSVEDIRARLQLLHHYSDLVYSSWRLLNLIPSPVSTTYVNLGYLVHPQFLGRVPCTQCIRYGLLLRMSYVRYDTI